MRLQNSYHNATIAFHTRYKNNLFWCSLNLRVNVRKKSEPKGFAFLVEIRGIEPLTS